MKMLSYTSRLNGRKERPAIIIDGSRSPEPILESRIRSCNDANERDATELAQMTIVSPFVLTAMPVAHRLPSLAREATTCAISSGVPGRDSAVTL